MPDVIRDLFDEYANGGAARVRQAIADKEPETEILDFKTNTDEKGNSTGKMGDNGKNVLAKAASALANAGGGVLVWGVEDVAERAEKPVLIPDVANFVVQLDKDTAARLSPPLSGIVHRALPDATLGDGSGFAVTYIPDGNVKPHMAITKGKQIYYIRSGGTSVMMPDAAVRAFVTSGTAPQLRVEVRIMHLSYTPDRYADDDLGYGGDITADIQFIVHNDGIGVAEDIALAVEITDIGRRDTRYSRGVDLTYQGTTYSATLHEPPRLKLFPGTSQIITTIEYRDGDSFGLIKTLVSPKNGWEARYALFARNFTLHDSVTFTTGNFARTRPNHHAR